MTQRKEPPIFVRERQDRPQPDGTSRWEVDCRHVPNAPKKRPLFGSEEEATTYKANLLKQIREGTIPTPEERAHQDQTLDVYVQAWLPIAGRELGEQTHRSYAQMLKTYVLPKVGSLPLVKIRRETVKALLQDARAAGLSQNTTRLIRASLSTVLTDAVDDGLIPVNPCIGLGRKGKKSAGTVQPKHTADPLSHDELTAFLAECQKPQWWPEGPMFATQVLCGMRPSEPRALTVGDLDGRNGTLVVSKSATLRGEIKGLKTERTLQSRTVNVEAALNGILDAHVKRLKAEHLKHGWQYGPSCLLFPSDANTVLDYANSVKVFDRMLAQAEIRHRTPYNLRDTFASLHLSAGRPLSSVAEQMGDNQTTVLKHYSRFMPKGGERYALVPAGGNEVPGTKSRNHRTTSRA